MSASFVLENDAMAEEELIPNPVPAGAAKPVLNRNIKAAETVPKGVKRPCGLTTRNVANISERQHQRGGQNEGKITDDCIVYKSSINMQHEHSLNGECNELEQFLVCYINCELYKINWMCLLISFMSSYL